MDAVNIDTAEPQQHHEDDPVDAAVHVCRVCLLGNLIMRDLFVEGDVISLSTKAMAFASVKILPGDGMPAQVCCECADKLEAAYDFKLQVEQADSVLRERYDSLNIKEELFFNEVEVHLEDRPDDVSEIDAHYEVTETLDNQVHSDKTNTLLKDHLALLEVEKLAQQDLDNGQMEEQHIQDDLILKEQLLHSSEQYIQVSEHGEQMVEEIETGCVDDDIKAEGMTEQEGITIEEHNYMVQQGYTLSPEQEQLINQEHDVNDDDHEAAEYLSMIDETEINEETAKKSQMPNEECEIEDNEKRNGENSDEENYFENLNLSSRITKYTVDKSDKIFFMCYLCDKQFLSKDVLKEHMHSHEEVRRTLCLKNSPEKSSKNPPVNAKPPPSGKKANKCPYCGKEYLYVISFNKHVKQHQKNEDEIKESQSTSMVAEDSVDSDGFDNNDTFEVIPIQKEEPHFSEDDVDDGKRRRVQIYPCDKCCEQFHNKSDLVRHTAEHNSEKCSICDKEFDSLEKLRDHRSRHVIQGVITEADVKEELANLYNKDYKQEIDQCESENDNLIESTDMNAQFKCPTCNLLFPSKKSLSKHLETHVKYRCKICGQEFTEKDHLRQHAEQHSSKTFKCSQCNKCFGNELTLRNHLIATNHKTIIRGEEYDPNKRIKRVAAKAAQKIIDKISTEDGFEDSERDEDNDEFIAEETIKNERLQGSNRKLTSKRDHDCGLCGKKCISRQALAKHMDYHLSIVKTEESMKKPVESKDYSRTGFGDEEDDDDDDDDFDGGLDWPMDNHECPTCKKRYSTKKSLLRHQLLHEEPNFECDICNVKFYRKDKLKAHYDKCSEKNPNQVRKCNICGDTFENNDILREHRSKHVDEGILTEEDLRELEPGSEERKAGEKIARKRRTDIVGLECTECNKQYTSRKGLLRHIQVHEGKKYLCDICPKKFYRREHLKIHVAKHNMVKPYKCTRCSKRFIKEEQLAAHLTKHERTFKKNKDPDSTAKRFLCEICSKSFTQSTTLVAHLRAHNGIKPYVCEVCARPFTTNAYLKMHMRTHTQERPYTCQFCARAFARADTLANHLTSHTGEAKYHCKYCPKNFRRLKSLKEHVFIHTGQRPYACPTCDRRFNNNGSRYAHSKRCKQNLLQNQGRQNQTAVQSTAQNVVEVVSQPTQPTIRLAQTVGQTMQLVQGKNIKTITITRQPDQDGTHQVIEHQEILMPLILPLTVTLTDADEDVI